MNRFGSKEYNEGFFIDNNFEHIKYYQGCPRISSATFAMHLKEFIHTFSTIVQLDTSDTRSIECDLHDGKFGNTSLSMAYNRYSSMPEDALPFPW